MSINVLLLFSVFVLVAKMDHSQHDCLAVVVLTHGELGRLLAHDTHYDADTLWSYFTSDKCPTLAGKPKLFFIQACRGDRSDAGITLKERTQTDGHSNDKFRIPTHADILVAYATVPGFLSWFREDQGSWFIQALCSVLREKAAQHDLLTLLTFVNQRVAIDYESYAPNDPKEHEKKKQVPYITWTLIRLVQFPPPVQNGASKSPISNSANT